MKLFVSIIALALILIAFGWQDASASLYPYGQGPVDQDTGEDHPWGGEQHATYDPGSQLSAEAINEGGITELSSTHPEFWDCFLIYLKYQFGFGRPVIINDITNHEENPTDQNTNNR